MPVRFIFFAALFTMCFINIHPQQAEWINLSGNIPGDSLGHHLTDVHFISNDTGWISTAFVDEIYFTIDGGNSFQIQVTVLGSNFVFVNFEGRGFSGGDLGLVYHTSDWGFDWNTIDNSFIDINLVESTPEQQDTLLAFGDSGYVYLLQKDSLVLLTDTLDIDILSATFPVSFNKGWICGGRKIYRYEDSVFTELSHPDEDFETVYFLNETTGWAAGGNGLILFTSDGGENWQTQFNPDPQHRRIKDIFFTDLLNGWAVGVNGVILKTNDGGANWSIEGDGISTNNYLRVLFTDLNNGYIVGESKAFLKYTEVTSVEDKFILNGFSLGQNYPNPFNPSTTISWQSPVGSHQSIKVYDVLGNEIASLVDEYRPAGSYEVDFNASGLPSGIYFYKLHAGSLIETKKMILLQ